MDEIAIVLATIGSTEINMDITVISRIPCKISYVDDFFFSFIFCECVKILCTMIFYRVSKFCTRAPKCLPDFAYDEENSWFANARGRRQFNDNESLMALRGKPEQFLRCRVKSFVVYCEVYMRRHTRVRSAKRPTEG